MSSVTATRPFAGRYMAVQVQTPIFDKPVQMRAVVLNTERMGKASRRVTEMELQWEDGIPITRELVQVIKRKEKLRIMRKLTTALNEGKLGNETTVL